VRVQVDEVMLANDEATIKAMKLVWERESFAFSLSLLKQTLTSCFSMTGMKLIIEPSSALSLAVLLSPPSPKSHPWRDLVESIVAGRACSSSGGDEVVRCLVVISGGNVELDKVLGWFQGVEA
jgi:threonine dehydratase